MSLELHQPLIPALGPDAYLRSNHLSIAGGSTNQYGEWVQRRL
ncbi:hypothetical protein [Sphingobacterium pedocola]|nr:hypothetical protein [Sphingobacterium pedocola]